MIFSNDELHFFSKNRIRLTYLIFNPDLDGMVPNLRAVCKVGQAGSGSRIELVELV